LFAIALKQKQYKTYILSDEVSQSRLEVVPERGGIITSWQVQGQEMLYLDTERFTRPDLTVRGGVPILFPICGNLPNSTYTWEGQQYTLKQHGFARDLAWEVTDRITQDLAGITLELTSNDQTRALYPFEFQVVFTYKLCGNQLEIHQAYTNHSPQPMPFSTGLHPYFVAPDKSELAFEIAATDFTDQRTQITHAFDGGFDFQADEIDVAFRQVSVPAATVITPTYRLALEYDPVYSTLVFWTLKDKPFYCLEPWTAPRNALNSGDHLLQLDPGATLTTVVRMTVTFP
jgi:galactose mutarotase-like enzyme